MALNFTGLLMLYALRVNLSVAIVSMVKQQVHQVIANSTELLKSSNGSLLSISDHENQTTTIAPPLLPTSQGEFDWDEKTQG